MKYKNLYYEFKIIDDSFYHQFSFGENLNTSKVIRVNAETKSMNDSIDLIFNELCNDLQNGYMLSAEEIEFVKTIRQENFK